MCRELQEFNDAVAVTPLHGHYWLCGGLLLGWARSGQPIDHDTHDVDFYAEAEDSRLVEQAAPALERAGFRPLWRYRNTAGQVTEYTFVRHGARFEVFLLYPAPGPDRRRYFVYLNGLEIENEVSMMPFEEIHFCGRSWLKPVDHERHLQEQYGPDWRIPQRDWRSDKAPCVVAVRPHGVKSSRW